MPLNNEFEFNNKIIMCTKQLKYLALKDGICYVRVPQRGQTCYCILFAQKRNPSLLLIYSEFNNNNLILIHK